LRWTAAFFPRPRLEGMAECWKCSRALIALRCSGHPLLKTASSYFRPRFPLAPGGRLHSGVHCAWRSACEGGVRSVESERRHHAPSSTFIQRRMCCRPISSSLYIQFSAPMGRGQAYRRIHLLDSNGAAVDLSVPRIGPGAFGIGTIKRLTVAVRPRAHQSAALVPREQSRA